MRRRAPPPHDGKNSIVIAAIDAALTSAARIDARAAVSRMMEVPSISKTILPNRVFCAPSHHRRPLVKTQEGCAVHFFLDFRLRSFYIWITLRSLLEIANFDVRENRSMKHATKKAAKKAPAKKKAAKKKK
jgi:hypothetical protein